MGWYIHRGQFGNGSRPKHKVTADTAAEVFKLAELLGIKRREIRYRNTDAPFLALDTHSKNRALEMGAKQL